MRETRADCGARVEPDGPPPLLLFEDRAGNDIARGQLGVGMDGEHKTLAEIVHEGCSFAPDRLGDQRHRVAPDGKRRRVELNELHVGEHRAGPRGHRDTVAGRFYGVGRKSIEAAHSAGGEHDGGCRERDELAGRILARAHAVDAISVDQEILRGRVLDDLDRGILSHRFDQRLEDLVPGRVSARFDDAPALMRRLTPQCEFALVGPVECRAELEQLFHARGCVLGEDLDDLRIADAGAGALRVDRVQTR